MIRLLWAVPVWIGFILLTIPIYLAGWILIPLAAALKAYDFYTGHDGVGKKRMQARFTWAIMAPYQNSEDGIANDTYRDLETLFSKIVYWSAYRNPINGLRNTPILSVKIDPKKVKYITDLEDIARSKEKFPHSWFAWHGLYACYFKQFMWRGELWRIWCGHKLYPSDSLGVEFISAYRKPRAGFALQFKRIKT